MRVRVVEKQLEPGQSTPEDHNVVYTYDNLNRLITEDANDANEDGYSIDYKYDLVGNRIEREVTVTGQQPLTTTCTYDPNTDRLIKEVHDGPVYGFIWNNQRIYAYAGNDGVISHYRLGGSSKDIGQFKAFFMGLPSRWSVYLFRTAMLLLVVAFFTPLIARGYVKVRKLRNTGPPIRLSLWHRCISALAGVYHADWAVRLRAVGAWRYAVQPDKHLGLGQWQS